jgi:adenylate kinase
VGDGANRVKAVDGVRPALNVLMLGPPGAGKGTQAERLARARGLVKISTGDILREAVQAGTKMGLAAKTTMEAGNLVPDDVMIGIVEERLNRDDARAGFVLDGFPRTVAQAAALDAMMNGRGPLVVLAMVVPEDILVRRLATRRICSKCGATAAVDWTVCGKCGGALIARVDDSIDIVRERLKIYLRQTEPLVNFYSPRGTFRQIDGSQPPDLVTAQVDAAIGAATSAAGAPQ